MIDRTTFALAGTRRRGGLGLDPGAKAQKRAQAVGQTFEHALRPRHPVVAQPVHAGPPPRRPGTANPFVFSDFPG